MSSRRSKGLNVGGDGLKIVSADISIRTLLAVVGFVGTRGFNPKPGVTLNPRRGGIPGRSNIGEVFTITGKIQ
jgi:hypothetical protein